MRFSRLPVRAVVGNGDMLSICLCVSRSLLRGVEEHSRVQLCCGSCGLKDYFRPAKPLSFQARRLHWLTAGGEGNLPHHVV